MWLLEKEQTDGCQTQYARNGREYRPHELAQYSVDGYCAETRTVYEFLGCYYHGCKCQPFRDVEILGGDKLAERYEQTMARIDQIKRAGYRVINQWECEFDEKPKLLVRPIIKHSPLIT
jgi:G:T-mismatch repair DNA endonuclease (very short patch repair protein)